MGKLIDLTGQIFGRWTVIGRASGHSKHTLWKCKCACGTERLIDGYTLRTGRTTSWVAVKMEEPRRDCIGFGLV